MPTAQEVANEAMNKRDSMVHITNEIFLIIQNDPELMRMYSDAVAQAAVSAVNAETGPRQAVQTVNSAIGRAVLDRYSEKYGLTHAKGEDGENLRNSDNVCTLIQSYQLFVSNLEEDPQ